MFGRHNASFFCICIRIVLYVYFMSYTCLYITYLLDIHKVVTILQCLKYYKRGRKTCTIQDFCVILHPIRKKDMFFFCIRGISESI